MYMYHVSCICIMYLHNVSYVMFIMYNVYYTDSTVRDYGHFWPMHF